MATVAATRARRLISAVVPPVGLGAIAATRVTEQAHPAAGAASPLSAADPTAAIDADHRTAEATKSRLSPSKAQSKSHH